MYPSSVGKREFLVTILIIGTSVPRKMLYELYSIKTYKKF